MQADDALAAMETAHARPDRVLTDAIAVAMLTDDFAETSRLLGGAQCCFERAGEQQWAFVARYPDGSEIRRSVVVV